MYSRLANSVASFVASRPGIVVATLSLVMILSAISSQNVKLTSGVGAMFSEENKIYRQYKQYERDFEISTGNIFLIVKGEDVLNRETFDLMLKIQERIESIEGVVNTVSPASTILQFYKHLPVDEFELKRSAEIYANQLVPKQTTALITISIATTDLDEQKEIARQIEEILKSTYIPPSLTVEVTGGAAMNLQVEREIVKSLRITMTVSTILMILILYFTFSGVVRKKITAFFPLIISVMSVQILYGLMPILGIPLSEHTNAALPMLIGLAIEYGAQLQNRYEEERKAGKRREESITISVTSTGLAILMALLTTVVGFMSMLTPGIPAMANFGVIASLGLIITYILTLTFLPAILKILDREEVREEIKPGILEKTLEIVASFTSKRPFGILVVAAIITIFGIYSSQFVEVETNYNKYLPENLPALQKFRELETLAGGQRVYTMVLFAEDLDAEKIKEIKEFSKYVVSREELIYDYRSIDKLLESLAAKGIEDEFAYLNYIPEEQRKFYISGDWLVVHFFSYADTYSEFRELYKSIVKDAEHYGFENFYLTGFPVLYSEMGRIMIEGQTTMTLAAYSFIVLLLLVIYRSPRKAVVPLVAITVVIGVMNLIMYFFGIKQTMLSIALNSMTLGLGIDFSIHVLERYFEERKRFDPITSIRRTIERTGKAVTTAALTMAGGFGSLMFSPFPIAQNFGLLAFIAIIFSLISALTVVPAFLVVTEKINIKKL
ncbi:MAG: hydrophobe/amphiphile efflux-3 (HAE3) family transporter [Archaeoglobaceae archaeon]|nr:hydrophobe/amphiphile efflux-3 (HAE3) family transporter [Archaeoglobaceae archaeon]MCX8152165.1 hydrophobe/amphiphile efflux-3 (HAE3) family transporter [Archaeoglobaceae archaeon]MDW8013881.1 hydrophobe/amphiphile efflux-3 (HAE3) family transporter [Archaeoglobaceae archaeon]